MNKQKRIHKQDSFGEAARILSPVLASYTLSDGRQISKHFFTAFRIGREVNCDLRLDLPIVSRQHAEVYFDGGTWCIRDLDSTNGLHIQGKRVRKAGLSGQTAIQLGVDGPVIHFQADTNENEVIAHELDTPTELVERYLDPHGDSTDNEHGIRMRQAFAKVRKRVRRRYLILLSGVLLLLGASIGVVFYQQLRLERMHTLAVDIFYEMREVELQVVKLNKALQERANASETESLREKQQQLEAMRGQYDKFLDQLGLFTSELSQSERLILRMARIFGESELDAPVEFIEEVEKYIKKWTLTDKFESSVQRATAKGYVEIIYREMVAQQLPPQFFYLALKESGLSERAIGPRTRYGIAKGAWQFIPATAKRLWSKDRSAGGSKQV